ncbi:hypothetical protein P7C71_g4555, partial [Lecanoromycetidae sp. Uapishka_2]
MPRVTRAALRSQEVQEESDLAASTPLPLTPIKTRAPLGEVSTSKVNELASASTSEVKMAPAKKGKGKKGNKTKKSAKEKKENKEQPDVEVLEDGNESSSSSAVEEACKDLLLNNRETQQTILEDQAPQTPPSAAVNAASQQISTKTATPYFNPEIHKTDDSMTSTTMEDKEDSFVANIGSRTPAKMANAEEIDAQSAIANKDDSFVEQIKARSPNKRISRIEDSVEALDALEEEIEKVGKLIPTTTENLRSPGIARKQATPPKNLEKKPNGSVRVKTSTAMAPKSGTNIKSTAPRPTIQPASKRVMTQKTGLSQGKSEVKPKSPASARAAAVVGPSALVKKRVSSVHKAPFQPTKSTKPPTRAFFELPGEAFSRKLKEQREERQKHEEEEKPKRHVFKARPVRISHAPEVKLTAAAKLRLSMAKGEPAVLSTPTNSPSIVSPGKTATVAPTGENKRFSSLAIAKRTTTGKPAANSSARVTRGPSLSASTTGTRNPSASATQRTAPTAEDLAQQKVKGKEVFGRTRVEIQEREKAKKEKEDAAKKARIDAAERGRLASREWAEKHRAKKLEVEKTKNGVA